MNRWFAGVVLALGAMAVFAVPVESAGESPTVRCVVTAIGDGKVYLADFGFQADTIVVERSVNGGQWWWRGRMEYSQNSGHAFQDELRSKTVMDYRIRAVVDGVLGEPDDCGAISLAGTVPPPSTCDVVVDQFGNVSLQVSSEREIYSSFIFYRTAGGEQRYWRARNPAYYLSGSAYDTARSGIEHQYLVRAVAANGDLSEPTTCGEPFTFAHAKPGAPTCQPIPVGLMAFQVESEGAARVAAYRSVDGGPQYWRGLVVEGIGWGAPDSDYVADSRYDFFFQGVGPTGLRSERVYCGSLTVTDSGFGLIGTRSFDGPLGG